MSHHGPLQCDVCYFRICVFLIWDFYMNKNGTCPLKYEIEVMIFIANVEEQVFHRTCISLAPSNVDFGVGMYIGNRK